MNSWAMGALLALSLFATVLILRGLAKGLRPQRIGIVDDGYSAYGQYPRPPMERQADGQRPTEDDLVTAMLGPRGVPGEPNVVRMTPQRRKKTPNALDPGHTA